MKILLIILAVLVMDVRDEERSFETKPCGATYKIKKQAKTAAAPRRNFILIRLQG
jgi:hypothetical protein